LSQAVGEIAWFFLRHKIITKVLAHLKLICAKIVLVLR
jgi:hypothetical protein